MLVCSSFSCSLFGVLIALSIGIITYFKWSYSYWKRKNLYSLAPTSWFGTMENPFYRSQPLGIWLKRSYDEFKKKGHHHGGIYSFTAPIYFPVHLDFIKNIMQNDFQYFMDRGQYYNEKGDPLSANLFTIEGQKWKNLRAKLTPSFTSGKMKMMFETFVECSNPVKSLVAKLSENEEAVDIKEVFARYTTDVIGSCAFGLECNSFKSPNSEFRQCGRQILKLSLFNSALQVLWDAYPAIGHLFNIRVFPELATEFFLNIVRDTVNYRKTAQVKRNDFLQLLSGVNTSSSNGKQEQDKTEDLSLTIEEIAAQCLAFFIAGFETSSSTMAFCLYELAKNQDIQQKVREEIDEVLSKHNNKITYDSISDMQYLTQVLDETLRKYPSAPVMTRICLKDYPVPNTNVVIEKGTRVFISSYGLHYDPDYFPNPENFDPGRFSKENKAGRHQFSYIPFGEGPHICIGIRFAMMQIKVVLTVLLKDFIFSFNRNTPNILTYNPKAFLLDSNETILLDAKPVHKVD